MTSLQSLMDSLGGHMTLDQGLDITAHFIHAGDWLLDDKL